MISVIIPLYNKIHFIEDTLESVFSQTYGDYEVIVIDDGSTDGSADVVRALQPRHACLRLIQQKNQGVSVARNRGIQEARGEWIAFLDADDVWHPEFLERLYSLSEEYPQQSFFCCAQEDRIIPTLPAGITIIGDHPQYEYVYCTGCSIIRRTVFEEIGGFRPGIQLGEDRDMWLRIACKYQTVYINEALIAYSKTTENNLSRTIDPAKSFPYWEWYAYPYPNRRSLYRYATNQIVKCVETFVVQKRYAEAWDYLKRTRGTTAVRLRLRLLMQIVWARI